MNRSSSGFGASVSVVRSRRAPREVRAAGDLSAGFIPPMLAVPGALPARTGDYGFEFKWDGVRAIAVCGDRGKLRLWSRLGRDLTRRYPEVGGLARVRGLAEAAGRGGWVLDGEIVAVDDAGRPDFGLLQHRMHLRDRGAIERARQAIPVAYMVFDLLRRGESLQDRPYAERREALEALELAGPAWRVPPAHRGLGEPMLAAARSLGLEGIVAKRWASPYRSGVRSPEWLKVKVTRRQEFIVGGWVPEKSGAADRVGSLQLGYYDRGRPGLHFAGGVGTGFDAEDHARLVALLRPRARNTRPFVERVPKPGVRYVEPDLVAEVEFAEWTRRGIVRHARFRGLRDDKRAEDVVREDATDR